VGVFRADTRGRALLANPAALRMLGYESVEALNAAGGVTHVCADPRDRKRLFEALRVGPVTGMEIPLRRVDGTIVVAAVSCLVLEQPPGRTSLLEGTVEDVTERKLMQDSIQESARRMTAIIDHLPDATFVTDRNGTVIAWNKATEALTGVAAAQMIGKGGYEYALPFYGERRPLLLDLALDPECAGDRGHTNLHREGDALVGQTQVELDGRTAHLLCRASALRDAHGEVTGAIETIHDITAIVEDEERLKLRNVLLATQQEASIDGILVVDRHGTMISFNHRFVELWGIPLDVVESRSDEQALAAVASSLRHPEEFAAKVKFLYEHPTLTSRDEILDEARAVGADGFVAKPVSQSSLLDTIVELLAPGQASRPSPRPSPDPPQRTLAGAHVLVVEDNEINQQIAVELLSAAGAIASVAANGAIAVQMVQEAAYDLVLMDLQMPEMDGFEATRLIRALPGREQLPIIATTAHAMVEEQQRCLDSGMNDHISKPIDPEAMFGTLGKWFKTVTPPATAPAAMRQSGTWPVTAPLATDEGLRRASGTRALYHRLLESYLESQGEAAARIGEALRRGDPPQAQLLAHTLKGVAGNLGAREVYAQAAELEAALRDPTAAARLAGLVEALGRANEAAVGAIRAHLQRDRERGGAPAKPPGPAPAALGARLARLATLLEASDTEAEDWIESSRGDLDAAFGPEAVATLVAAVRAFDYERARTLLGEMAARARLPL
jgi:PAS domain S-box-containing protein